MKCPARKYRRRKRFKKKKIRCSPHKPVALAALLSALPAAGPRRLGGCGKLGTPGGRAAMGGGRWRLERSGRGEPKRMSRP